jgi:hypothetical protein
MGSGDGVVRLQRTARPYGPPEGRVWQAPLHDMSDGKVGGSGFRV